MVLTGPASAARLAASSLSGRSGFSSRRGLGVVHQAERHLTDRLPVVVDEADRPLGPRRLDLDLLAQLAQHAGPVGVGAGVLGADVAADADRAPSPQSRLAAPAAARVVEHPS